MCHPASAKALGGIQAALLFYFNDMPGLAVFRTGIPAQSQRHSAKLLYEVPDQLYKMPIFQQLIFMELKLLENEFKSTARKSAVNHA
jgi:hypothetical protein